MTDHPITLAIPYHDPPGELTGQLERLLPWLTRHFAGIAVNASPEANRASLALLAKAGAQIEQEERSFTNGVAQMGKIRRAVVDLALRLGASWVFYCDGDRLLHWVEHYPVELAGLLQRLPDYDCTVYGRTPRAFATHPRIQTATESLINEVYAAISGKAWDVTAAARGLSAQAARALVAGCHEDSFGVDAVWPLFLQQAGGFSLTEIQTEGLEFETAGQYLSEVATAGGEAAWKQRLDADAQRWAFRLNIARIEVEAMIPYQASLTGSR
jgi:hypothetical protein